MRRSANLTALVASILWGLLFLAGRDGTYGIYEQGAGIAPNSGQIDYYIVFPLMILLGVAGCAWLTNGTQRWFPFLGTISALSLFALLPYLFGYSGGV